MLPASSRGGMTKSQVARCSVEVVPQQGEEHASERVPQERQGDDPVAVVGEQGDGEIAAEECLEGKAEQGDQEKGRKAPALAHQCVGLGGGVWISPVMGMNSVDTSRWEWTFPCSSFVKM